MWENQINQKHCVQSFPWNKTWWVSGNTGISRFSPGRCGKLAADLLLYLAVLIPFSDSYKLSIKLYLIWVNIHIEKYIVSPFLSQCDLEVFLSEWMNPTQIQDFMYSERISKNLKYWLLNKILQTQNSLLNFSWGYLLWLLIWYPKSCKFCISY